VAPGIFAPDRVALAAYADLLAVVARVEAAWMDEGPNGGKARLTAAGVPTMGEPRHAVSWEEAATFVQCVLQACAVLRSLLGQKNSAARPRSTC